MGTGNPIDLALEDSKPANRGRHLEAVAQMTDARTDTDHSGHQDGVAIRRCRDAVSPDHIRRYVTSAHAPALGGPSRTTTALAATNIGMLPQHANPSATSLNKAGH
jgi:hypothetical protein